MKYIECTGFFADVRVRVGVCVCVHPSYTGRGMNMQGPTGLSLTTKTFIERCVSIPAREGSGRNGRSWGPHMIPHPNACAVVGSSCGHNT